MLGHDFRVAALVASTGGLDALARVLGMLPADFPAAVIALQHAEPTRPSALPKLLGPRCAMPVRTAADGLALTPGAVFAAPPGHHMLVTPERTVALFRSGEFPPYRPSADLLFVSMALSLGARAIGVVLSGLAHDGAAGVAALLRFGGTVLASDEATSTEFSMPRAAMEVTGGLGLPLDEIADALVEATHAVT